MTNRSAELILIALYGDATKELTNLLMAAENAFDSYGKKSIFGRDKGREAEGKFAAALARAVIALSRVGKINNPKDAEETFTALQKAMVLVREAYPNWPRGYKYLELFFSGNHNIELR